MWRGSPHRRCMKTCHSRWTILAASHLIATRVDQCDAIENGHSTRAERVLGYRSRFARMNQPLEILWMTT